MKMHLKNMTLFVPAPGSDYAFKPIADQSLRSNQVIVPQRLNAALEPMSRLLAILMIGITGAGCSSDNSRATFEVPRTGCKLTIELEPAHPSLAEYNLILLVDIANHTETSFIISPNTGGYNAANLFACGDGNVMVESYVRSAVVNTQTGEISEGQCDSEQTYLGIFDGGGSKTWAFYPASERPETPLTMRGG